MINWEGNYTLPDGREVLLEVKCEAPDYDTGIMGMAIVEVHAYNEDGESVELSDSICDHIAQDAALYERIEDKLASDAEHWYTREHP